MKAKRSPILRKSVNLLAIFILALIVTGFQTQPVFAAALLNVDNGNPACSDTTGDPFCTIQAAINAASPGDTINIAAGTYAETLSLVDKNNIIIDGAGEGVTIIDAHSSLGYGWDLRASGVVLKDFTFVGPTAGTYGIKVSGNSPVPATGFTIQNVTIQNSKKTGLDINGVNGVTITDVTVTNTVSGAGIALTDVNNATLTNITTSGNAWGSIAVMTYGRYFPGGSDTITLTNITGTEPVYTEVGNYSNPASPYPVTNFTASEFVYKTVNLTDTPNHVFYTETETAATALALGFAHPAQSFVINTTTGHYVVVPGMTIQAAINAATAGSTIDVAAGTYTELGQIVISKNLTIIGADKLTTIIKPGQNTGTAGDARAWILVNTGVEFNLSNVTLDGSGKLVETAFLSHGTGVFEDNIVKNMYYNKYVGRGVALYGGNMIVRNNSFSNIQRIGMYAALAGTTNAVFDGNTYVGKGPGDWLDYGIEVEAGAHAEIMNNTISDAVGVAASDGSTSAGMYLTTFFAPGTSMNAHNNILLNNTAGIAVGYQANDTSTTLATHNKFEGNEFGITTTGPTVTAANNWWGSASGPAHTSNPSGTGDAVSDAVNFTPWLCSGTDTSPEPGFQPSLQANSSCTNINVEIAGDHQETFSISSQGTLTQVPFAGVNNGPVKLQSTASILAGERIIYKVNGVQTSFSEMMALPASQLDTVYWLPWYNNKDLDTQLRIANVTDQTATITITIGGVPQPSFDLAAGGSTRKSFAGVDAGPVKIESTQNIVAAERVIYKVNGVQTSFSEMMALPASQLDTVYWFTRYNNKDLNTQLRIANVTDQTATITITIGGVPQPSFNLAAGGSTRKSFAGVNGGLVKVESNVPVVVAERVIYKVQGINTSFSELMGLPNTQLDTIYWLPWYNNKDLDTHLRFGLP